MISRRKVVEGGALQEDIGAPLTSAFPELRGDGGTLHDFQYNYIF